MSNSVYLVPHVKIMELICILNVLRYAVFVVTFPGCSIRFNPTVSCTSIGYSFCVCTSTAMHEYVTVRTTGILLCATKQIVSVPFFTCPGNPSASRPNSFDCTFCQSYLVFCSFDCIKYLYYIIHPLCGSITVLMRYQGKVSFSICMDMLCVA